MIIHISEVANGFLLVTEQPGAQGQSSVTISYVFLTLSDLLARIKMVYGGLDLKKGG